MNPEADNTRGDFFQGDPEAGLERLRTRLLDLTNRNRLLNFRHSKRATLRAVDELPGKLFDRLSSGERLIFRPVPEPKRDEYESDQNGDAGADNPPTIQGTQTNPLESSHQERSRGERRKPTPEKHAEKLGINTNYDLPSPSKGGPVSEAHDDRYIQTLHYPQDLETKLRRIDGAARTAIEESGTNMLYLVFGVLEWYESDESNQERFAPVFMVPVTLTRSKPNRQTGVYEYFIEYSGEDVTTNISLSEKLKRDFALELPMIADEEDPEAYFRRVKRLCTVKPRWKVRRWITLTLLYFGKLLMYRDLDPAAWPTGTPLLGNPRIREFFLGTTDTDDGLAEDYFIDSPQVEHQLPLLVHDADSSQHSALIDALNGKNLVIQGPPGTGKSQTITNLIAAALERGKTVLFVSEKLAALEVVRRRLDEAGIGIFCLELHSHKTQKKELIEDIRQRLKRKGHFPTAHILDEKLKLLDDKKKSLITYVELINLPLGSLGVTIFDVLWKQKRLYQESPFDPSSLRFEYLDLAKGISPTEFEIDLHKVHTYADHLADVLDTLEHLRDHPWHGTENSDLHYLGEQEFINKGPLVIERANALRSCLETFSTSAGVSIPLTPKALRTLVDLRPQLPHPGSRVLGELMPRLAAHVNRRLLTAFVQEIFRWQQLHLEVQVGFLEIPVYVPEKSLRAKEACDSAFRLNLRHKTPKQMREFIPTCERVRAIIDSLDRFFEAVLAHLSCRLEKTVSNVPLFSKLLTLLAQSPFDLLSMRHDELDQEGARLKFRLAQKEAVPLLKLRESLRTNFFLESLPDPAELEQYATTISQSGFWARLFGSRYRASKQAYKSLRKTKERATRITMSQDLRALARLLRGQTAFATNPQHQAFFGLQFAGLDTPFEAYARLLDWYETVREELSSAIPESGVLANALIKCPTTQLKALHNWVKSHPEQQNQLHQFEEHISPLREVLTEWQWASGQACLSTLLDESTRYITELPPILDSWREINVKENVPCEDILKLLDKYEAYSQIRESLDNNSEVASLLGPSFNGVNTDTDRVSHTLTVAEALANETLPAQLQGWLFSPEVEDRLRKLGSFLGALAPVLNKFQTSYDEFVAFGHINPGLWYESSHVLPEDPELHALVNRLDRAVANPVSLSGWLDLLRARRHVEGAGLATLAKLAEAGKIPPNHLGHAYQFLIFNSLAKQVLDQHPSLSYFSGLTLGKIREEFNRYDRELIGLHRQRVAHLVDKRKAPSGIGTGPIKQWTQLALIQNEIQKQRRHIPIRQLVTRAGAALQALKPCYMMGPLSVAQYLKPGRLKFDLVVMDEASQLKPEDALGAIARGGQMVIVGDSQQLPPTTFFDRLFAEEIDSEEDIDLTAIEGAESILEIASVLYRPQRQLRWHYRSQHGSLIAFSNREFYNGNLIVFPSPFSQHPALGVKYRPVADGVYENRRNRIEAETVVEAALDHMERHPGESLGIVALNTEQKELIDDIFQDRLKKDPFAQRYLERRQTGNEEFFVKNLENVQGDERDVIFISITYGPDPRGNLYQRFGPINSSNGYRRLNVLFTRAKKRVVVFSSMDAENLRLEPGSSQGLRALKGYLTYAKTGLLEQASAGGREPANDFELSVSNALRSRGYETVAQVGVAGFFIDLAVWHPKKAGTYIIGVECDGATYHSARSVRDRDRLRQEILENLGWKIHRIWSTDWFKDHEREIRRLTRRIEELTERDEATERVVASVRERPTDPFITRGEQITTETQEAQVTDREPTVFKGLTRDEARKQLVDLREQVIKTEFPEVDPARGLLRETMLQALLLQRPTARDEWLALISGSLRMETDVRHAKYLDQVLNILSQVSE